LQVHRQVPSRFLTDSKQIHRRVRFTGRFITNLPIGSKQIYRQVYSKFTGGL
jgi:translation initiation factor IF-3